MLYLQWTISIYTHVSVSFILMDKEPSRATSFPSSSSVHICGLFRITTLPNPRAWAKKKGPTFFFLNFNGPAPLHPIAHWRGNLPKAWFGLQNKIDMVYNNDQLGSGQICNVAKRHFLWMKWAPRFEKWATQTLEEQHEQLDNKKIGSGQDSSH